MDGVLDVPIFILVQLDHVHLGSETDHFLLDVSPPDLGVLHVNMGEVGVSKLLQAVPEQLHLVVAGKHCPHDWSEAVLLTDAFDVVVEEGVMEI